jgi:hypothetical protein
MMKPVVAVTPGVYVAESSIPSAGRGVFAARDYEPGEMIESCPVVVLGPRDLRLIEKTALDYYYFDWGDDQKGAGVVLGLGSIYNHSFDPVATYEKHYLQRRMDIIARKRIVTGDEITINYNYDPGDTTPLRYDWARC